MTDPTAGPFLFDTSAASYLARSAESADRQWVQGYGARSFICISVVTVLERVRGYALAWERADPSRRPQVNQDRLDYLASLEEPGVKVLALSVAEMVVAGQLMALWPTPPSPPRRSHRRVESRQDRLSRWRFDILTAATALVAGLPLVHNNPVDFETLRAGIERSPERFPGVGPLNLILVKRLWPVPA